MALVSIALSEVLCLSSAPLISVCVCPSLKFLLFGFHDRPLPWSLLGADRRLDLLSFLLSFSSVSSSSSCLGSLCADSAHFFVWSFITGQLIHTRVFPKSPRGVASDRATTSACASQSLHKGTRPKRQGGWLPPVCAKALRASLGPTSCIPYPMPHSSCSAACLAASFPRHCW